MTALNLFIDLAIDMACFFKIEKCKLVVYFNNVKPTHFLYKRHFGSFFSSYMYVTCTWKKLPKRCLYKKFVRKMLMKLTAEWQVRVNSNKKL